MNKEYAYMLHNIYYEAYIINKIYYYQFVSLKSKLCTCFYFTYYKQVKGVDYVITIENVCKKYTIGDEIVYALKNVHLNIQEGEFVSIIGASGSGKSTLMNIMGCLDVPDSGQYFLDGENVLNMNDNRLAEIRNKKIGFVFQASNLLPKLTAMENVELPLVYRNMSKKGKTCKSYKIY